MSVLRHKTSICDDLIPVVAVVDTYLPIIPAKRSGHPDTWAPEEGGEIEWHLETTKGFDWPALMGMASQFELGDIQDDLIRLIEADRASMLDEPYEDDYDPSDAFYGELSYGG